MMNKLILGRYLPGDSLIHRLDPRAKLIASFYFIGIIFLANNFVSYAMLGIFTLCCLLLSKIDFGFFLRGVRPLIWLILFLNLPISPPSSFKPCLLFLTE